MFDSFDSKKLGRVSVLMLALIFCLLSLGARAEEERVLLLAKPELHASPGKGSQATAKAWEPGRRVKVVGKQEAEGMTWFKVQDEHGGTGWLPDALLAPQPAPLDAEKLKEIGTETVDRYHGLAPEYLPPDLVAVGPRYDEEVSPKMRREAAEALRNMFAAARGAGVKLYVVSGFRPWSKQQELYERRVRQSGWGQQTVAKPGHSEHQLGTAVDLSDGDKDALLTESFGETKAGRWLHDNAWMYGFAISFTRHNEPQTGIAPEPWHYRYWGIGQARTRHMEALGERGTEK